MEFTKVKREDLQRKGSIALVMGASGTGKTTLAKYHEGKKKILVSFDNSFDAHTVDSKTDVYIINEPKDFSSANAFTAGLEKITKGADLLVFDNLSALENTVIANVKEVTGNADDRAGYGYVQKFLHVLTEWASRQPFDILFTLWGSSVVDDFGNSIFQPTMNQKSFARVNGFAKISGKTVHTVNGYEVEFFNENGDALKNTVNSIEVIQAENFWKCVHTTDEELAQLAAQVEKGEQK